MLRKISLAFLLLLTSASTWAAEPVSNTIAMSYATMSITQMTMANAAMRAGGNFSLSVQAIDGGGRGPPNFPNDIANLTITFYNYSNGVIGTAASNNTTGWGWNTYTVNSTNCGGASCSQLAYFVVRFTGNDGGYWAGNNGTNFKDPKLTFTPTGQTTVSTVNILYNPEFGVNGTYSGSSAPSGWSSSTGAWGGNTRPQVFNSSGTVNAAGGGFTAAANTSSARAGGYAQITTSIANQNIAGGGSNAVWLYEGNMSAAQWYNQTLYIAAGWTWACSDCAVKSGTVTSGVNNDGIYQITIVNGTGGAVSPDSGKVYTFYPPGYVAQVTVVSTTNSTIITTTTTNGVVYTYRQPVTVTTYSDGTSTTVNNGAATLLDTTATGVSGGITTPQTTTKNTAQTKRNNITNDGIYIEQAGSNNVIDITQSGNNNSIQGKNSQAAQLNGDANIITIKQGNAYDTVGKNLIQLETAAGSNNNAVRLYQGYTADGTMNTLDTGGHIINLGLLGTSNQVIVSQTNTALNAGHYSDLNINGNTNNLTITQRGNGGKTLFSNITGNSNTVSASQDGLGQNYLTIDLSGNGHSVIANQLGNGNHLGNIDLTNSGGSSTVNLTQSGNTAQSYSITQTCFNPAGCGATVTQP